MAKLLDTVLLLALPASGKSEVRKYLDGLKAETCKRDFGIGETLQLDDYPYVHFMHRIDDELAARGYPYIFYKGPNRPFGEPFEWGTLIHMLNEDYDDLLHKRTAHPASAAQLLFDRLDAARARAGLPEELAEVPYRLRCEVAEALEDECAKELANKNKVCSKDKKGKTVFIEMARGGENGAAFPLTPPRGYEYAFSQLSQDILDRACILYVWVTPEDSRRKNIERARPDGQGSILHHSVPMEVMLGDYGCDDIEHLMKRSGKPDTIHLERLQEETDAKGARRYALRTWDLPIGRFDNRKDLTSFIRNKVWKPTEVGALHRGLKAAFDKLARIA
jgi:hypothetical protein